MTDLSTQPASTASWLAECRASGVAATDANRAMQRASRPRLTAVQRRRVRELVEDEGETRASAIAWVLGMEPEVSARRTVTRIGARP